MASGKKGKRKAHRETHGATATRVQAVPSRDAQRRRPTSTEDLYGGGYTGNLLNGRFAERTDIHELIQRRHEKGMGRIDEEGRWVTGKHTWKVPYGVRMAFRERLTYSQIASKYPFFVQWTSPKTGKKLRKRFMSLGAACEFIATKAQYVDSEAFVVVRTGFFIPRKLMGKFPRKMEGRQHYWCPLCMQPRRFRATGDTFHGRKKFKELDRQGNWTGLYEWREVKLAVLECPYCGITNRDHKFRTSNQPLEKRRFKQGVRRARRRR